MTAGWTLDGLDALRDRLADDLRDGRIHHGLLLTGPVGVGKRTLAAALARGLLCPELLAPGGCHACGSCHRVSTDQHPDVLWIERPAGKTSIPVDSVRGLVAMLERGSLEGRGRVAILVEAADLGAEGQNALLKTLEEPAPNTWLILTTARPETLLDTVRSRTERIAVAPLTESVATDWLIEHDGVAAAAAREAAVLAQGSIGEARRLLADGLDAWRELLGPILDSSEPGSSVAWAKRVVEAAEAGDGGIRQARRDRARLALRLSCLWLRAEAMRGRDEAWDAVAKVFEAQDALRSGLAAELVLQDLHQRLRRP